MFIFQLSYSPLSSLLAILFCIYCSCFIPLIRFNRHCLLFYSVYIVHLSTLLFAFIVTACYFILYILFMFQLSYSLQSSLLTILFCIYCSCFNSLIHINRHYLLIYSVYIVHVSTLLFALIFTAHYFILYILFMFQLSYSLQSSLLIILFRIYCSCFNSLIRFNHHCLLFYGCIYCSCFNSLIRFNRHCLLFYSVYIVHVSTLLFALIVTVYHFTL